MSAFLGPIHYWLYGKITLQQQLVEEVTALAKDKGITDLESKLNSTYGEFDSRPLEEIIDEDNIHGWLQDKVSRVEYKLAEAVTQLLTQNKENMNELENIFYKNGELVGEELVREEGLTVPRVYKAISDSLLDGMPCDHAIQIIKQEVDEVIWKRSFCVHEHYWKEVGGDIKNYYELRKAWLKGLAKAVGLTFEEQDERTYALKRGE
ncbi:MAG: hypothetical protein H9872_04315 [Candidatus Cellulosilyticum pullistercoris]|uniref:Uncharacterized protein n=1 Tax=Candidatus Cellulosilyticum pullistercoris TaxID=2838521 RepID=A0A9E2KAD3_9FIRM|nr:hypothetical protein [Candidatus Cellulosilyticum pullistercoris]